MSSDNIIYKCQFCDCKSKWKSNITRHMVRNHTAPNVNVPAPNVNVPAPNVNVFAPNVNVPAPNVNVFEDDNIQYTNQCTLCNKIFSRKCILTKHIEKCKGINNSLQCEFCNKIYSSRQTKSIHLRICKIKKELDSQALIIHTSNDENINDTTTTPNQNTSIGQINNMQNANIQNANTINNNNNNNTNNITNVIVFDPEKMELLHDHITKSKFTKMVTHPDFVKILTDYSTEILSRKENQCVRKTNLLSSSSAIHMGNDKWIYQSDKEVLPKLLSNIASNFKNITEEYKIKIMKQLDTFMTGVTCEATDYHDNEKDEVRLKKLFKHTLTNVKHLLFNYTKETLMVGRKI